MKLLNIYHRPDGTPVVSGRELFAAVSGYRNRDDYTNWIKTTAKRSVLNLGTDYFIYKAKGLYQADITLPAALAMARISRGHEKAKYVDYLRAAVAGGSRQEPTESAPTPLFEPTVTTQTEPAKTPTLKDLLSMAQKLAENDENGKGGASITPEEYSALERKIEAIDAKVNTLVYFFQNSAQALSVLPVAQLPVDLAATANVPTFEPTVRERINFIVNSYAKANNIPHQEVWNFLYKQLKQRFNFEVRPRGEGAQKTDTYLDIVERSGQLNNLFAIATEGIPLTSARA